MTTTIIADANNNNNYDDVDDNGDVDADNRGCQSSSIASSLSTSWWRSLLYKYLYSSTSSSSSSASYCYGYSSISHHNNPILQLLCTPRGFIGTIIVV